MSGIECSIISVVENFFVNRSKTFRFIKQKNVVNFFLHMSKFRSLNICRHMIKNCSNYICNFDKNYTRSNVILSYFLSLLIAHLTLILDKLENF